MSAQYSRDHCKLAVGKILQIIGWHSINSTPLDVLTDILSKYIQQISKITMDYSNEFGQTEANLDHLGLALQEMGINLSDLEEYVTFVNFGPGAHPTPKFPVPKENNLNFLKPGSKEVVTRPVHIHEHLPPMNPLLEDRENEEDNVGIKQEVIEEVVVDNAGVQHQQQFKKPAEVSPEFRRFKREDEGARPTREISSVMMTTSGFLSPAREGKLPEAKAPAPPPPPEPPVVPTTPTGDLTLKKKEKRKEKIGKELFKPIPEEKPVAKKTPTMKDFVKMKQKVAAAANSTISPVPLSQSPKALLSPVMDIKPHIPNIVHKVQRDKFDKALAAAKAKTEKLNTTITPIPALPPSITFQPIEKLFNEPDKKKINILKKISNVKEAKSKKGSRANTPSLIVDEPSDIVNKIALSSDITIEPIHPMMMQRSPGRFDYCDDSSIPPIPEAILNPPPQKEKRKRKDTRKVKRPKKNQNYMDAEIINLAMLERPNTPDLMAMRHIPPMHPGHLPFPFMANFGGPGLIPPQLSTPLFPFSQLRTFGKNPYFPMVPNMPQHSEPVPLVSPKIKEAVEIKPVEVVPPKPPPPKPQPIQVAEASSSTAPAPIPTPAPPPVTKEEPPAPPPPAAAATAAAAAIPPPPVVTTELSKDKKIKEHKKEKKDKLKKKNKKEKVKEKAEKKKLKELKKDNKEKGKKEKRVKKKEKGPENPIPKILLKVNSPSSRPETPESVRKLNIKPIVKRDEETTEDKKREPSPGGLAKIAALVTGPPKPRCNLSPVMPAPEKPPAPQPAPPPSPAVPEEVAPIPAPPRTPGRPRLNTPKAKQHKPKKVEQTFKKVDELGNEVWFCPPCGQQDDGRPMIGCDSCDAWYHWVCVGIQIPPDENENWYCKPCLVLKNEGLQTDKKRKRKRKEKKEH